MCYEDRKWYILSILYGRLTDSRSDLGTAMDGYGYDDTEMERGGQGKV